jgi:predicted GNAT family N-acyltransferase
MSMAGEIVCRPPETPREREEAFRIRNAVFVEEQEVPLSLERDEEDDRAFHLIAFVDGEPLGTARMLFNGERGKIGRVAVLKKARGRGVGKALMETLKVQAYSRGLKELCLNAQIQVIPFYQELGYRLCSDEFLDAGILHRSMILDLVS